MAAKTKKPVNQPSTADAEDVARFEALADSWWDADGPFRPLHQLNPARLGFIRDRLAAHFGRDGLAPGPLRGIGLLDIGCGGGLLCEPLCRLGASVTGIDAGAENIAAARAHARMMGLDIDYRHVLPEQLKASLGAFDVVLNMEVIEHVADVDGFLAASAACLAPGGAMVLSTINRTLKALALAKIGAEYLLRWVPAGTHDWRQFVRPSELASGLRAQGLEIRDLKGLVYGPLSGEWRLSADIDVNYLAFASRA